MQGSRCNGQWGGLIRDRDGSLFLLKGPGASAQLPCGGGNCCAALSGWSKPRQIMHWPREELGTGRAPLVLSNPTIYLIFPPGSRVWFPHPLSGSYLYFRVFYLMSLGGLRHGPPHLSAMGGASTGLAGPGCTRQVGLRPWLESKPCRYLPLLCFCTPWKAFHRFLAPSDPVS